MHINENKCLFFINAFKLRFKNIYDNIVFLFFMHLLGTTIIPINRWIGSLICLYAVAGIIICIVKRGTFRMPFSGLAMGLFSLYLLLDFFCVIVQSYFRGNPIWGNEILSFFSYHIVVSNYCLAFFLPFITFLNYRKFKLSAFLQLAILVSIIGIVCFLFEAGNLLSEYGFPWKNYSDCFDSVAFCLFLLPLMKNKRKYFVIAVFGIITLLITTICARRGATLTIGIIFLFSACLYVKIISYKNALMYWLLIIGFILGGFILGGFIFYRQQSNALFQNMAQKGIYDSREDVARYFEKDMFNSPDIWFGRGMNGMYYCPQRYIVDGKYEYVKYRYAIETGFYHLILKGGIIFAVLHVLILFGAVINGLFLSRNMVVKAFSLWILLSLIELYPFGWPSFSIKFLLVWIGACICYDRIYLNMDDEQIRQILKIQ